MALMPLMLLPDRQPQHRRCYRTSDSFSFLEIDLIVEVAVISR
jgi:hypothetical protein